MVAASTIQSPRLRVQRAALLAVMLMASAPAAEAYTAHEAELCMKDVFKLCASAVPNIAKVAGCMNEHRETLNSACAEAVDRFFRDRHSISRDPRKNPRSQK